MIHNFYLDRNAKNETNGKNYFLLVYPDKRASFNRFPLNINYSE